MSMADKIYIRDLALRCIIGVYPEERREKRGRRYIHPKYMQWTGLLAQDIGARLQAP